MKTTFPKYDVLRFVKRYVKDYRIISNGKELSVNCHWCTPADYKKKLTINAKSGLFHCWKCNEKGNFLKFSKAYGKTTIDLENFLTGSTFSESVHVIDTETHIQYPESFKFLSDCKATSITASKYFNYLFNRGLTEADINYYNIGFCTSGKLHDRVIVPVYNDNNLVSYIARSVIDAKPKVLTPPSLPGTHGVKDYVFNLDRAKDTKVLYVGEGVFDAIALGVSGICLFGKESTNKQLAAIINSKCRRIVVCLDGDAYTFSVRLATKLLFHCDDVRIARFPVDKDPASLKKEELLEIISQAEKFDGNIKF